MRNTNLRQHMRNATVHNLESAKSLQLRELQGQWGDDAGMRIDVSGAKAQVVVDETNTVYRIGETHGSLVLRGARLTGSTIAPIWKYPSGVEWKWARTRTPGTGDDPAWAKLFHTYKAERLKIRMHLHQAILSHDFEKLSTLKAAWDGGFGFPLPAPQVLRERLALGGCWVPGVCFRHRQLNYRGVILACEPWCTAPAIWRAQRGVPALQRGEAQPFYHVALDERDCPGSHAAFVAEEDLVADEAAFPVQAKLADSFLVRSEALGGYLVGPKLEERLQQHRANGFFTV